MIDQRLSVVGLAGLEEQEDQVGEVEQLGENVARSDPYRGRIAHQHRIVDRFSFSTPRGPPCSL